MNKLGHYLLALDYIEGFNDHAVTAGELAIIYSILPGVLLDLQSGEESIFIDVTE